MTPEPDFNGGPSPLNEPHSGAAPHRLLSDGGGGNGSADGAAAESVRIPAIAPRPPLTLPGMQPESAEEQELREPSLYINRELSLIEFNRRVLEEAYRLENPLLERVKFMAIFSNNMDEFFMVRVSGLLQQVLLGVSDPRGRPDAARADRGYPPPGDGAGRPADDLLDRHPAAGA